MWVILVLQPVLTQHVISAGRSHELFSQPQDFSREVSLHRQSQLCHIDMISTASFGLEALAAVHGVNHQCQWNFKMIYKEHLRTRLIGEAMKIFCKICSGKHTEPHNWILNIIASSCIQIGFSYNHKMGAGVKPDSKSLSFYHQFLGYLEQN